MNTSVLFSYAVRALVMLVAIPVHEFAHAIVSYWLGDDTAKKYGRLTLNPLAHLDIMGVVCMIFVGVGWAKPVPIRTSGFKHPKLGMAVTALAGPVANIIIAFISAIFYKLLFYVPNFGQTQEVLIIIFSTMLSMNITLAVFNMIPIPPLDGSKILMSVLPNKMYFGIMKYDKYMMLTLFVVLITGFLDKPLAYVTTHVLLFIDKATFFCDIIFKNLAI